MVEEYHHAFQEFQDNHFLKHINYTEDFLKSKILNVEIEIIHSNLNY